MENLNAFFWPGDIEQYFIGHQAEEIFKTRPYAPYLEGIKDAYVLDLGANLGLFTLYARKYAKHVWSVEPDPENFAAFAHTAAFGHWKNVTLIQKAIYIENGPFPLYQPANKTAKSMNAAVNHPGAAAPVMIEAITIDTLFEQENIEHVHLLKLDIEGAETEVVSGAGFRKIADKIDVVVGEWHDWSGRNKNQLAEAFKNNNFDFQWLEHDASIFVAKHKWT